jgi:hypothetical protein
MNRLTEVRDDQGSGVRSTGGKPFFFSRMSRPARKVFRRDALDFPRGIAIDLISIAVLVVYFLHFALQSLSAPLRPDDMMNMWQYWHAGWLKAVRASLCFWSSVGRPLGAIYYLPLHSLFDLHPKPYRVVTIALIAATIPIAYLLGRSLSSSWSVACLAVFAWSYHPRLSNLVFLNSFIYDVLCNLFYLATLAWYIGIRERDRFLRPLQLCGCLALYIGALNSKEMAVTLPLIVLVYELLRCFHQRERQNFFQWIWHNASPALVAGLVTVIYSYNKIYGSESWAVQGIEVYIPHYSWPGFITSNANFFSHIFYLFPNHVITAGELLAAWALAFLYAFLRRDRMLELMAFWVVITPLPLAFVTPRGGACLTIILFGWVMILAKLVSDLSMLITRLPLLNKAAVFPVRAGIMLCVVILLGVGTERQHRRYGLGWLKGGEKTAHVIEAFRALNLHPRPGSEILLTDNPFAGSSGGGPWVPLFIAGLLWNDHSLTVYQEGKSALNSRQIAKMNYVLEIHEYKVDPIRLPH